MKNKNETLQEAPELQELLDLLPLQKSLPSEIYHYTSPDGLLGIIQSKKLWFTRYDCLNDDTEGKYIFEVLNDVCLQMKK